MWLFSPKLKEKQKNKNFSEKISINCRCFCAKFIPYFSRNNVYWTTQVLMKVAILIIFSLSYLNKFRLNHLRVSVFERKFNVMLSGLIRFISFPPWTWLKKEREKERKENKKDFSELCYFPIGCANTSCVRGPLKKWGFHFLVAYSALLLWHIRPLSLSLSLPFSLFFPRLPFAADKLSFNWSWTGYFSRANGSPLLYIQIYRAVDYSNLG